MVAAIGSATVSAMSGGSFGTAGLEAQIARYEKQLSDCVNCASAKTPEGKKAIAEISNKISATRARVDEMQATKQVAQPLATKAAAGDASKSAVMPDTAASPKQSYSTVGSLVDLFG
jgi:hypothetical protein